MRSKLFVPASRPELFPKALAGDADALSFDLEDAVDASQKGRARAELRRFLDALEPGHGKTIIVRVNGMDTPHFEDDLDAVVVPGVDLINLPKPESDGDVRSCAEAIARREGGGGAEIGILANIETPRALRHASEIAAACPRVHGLQVGWADLLEPLGIDRGNAAVIQALQLQVRLAAGEAGVWACDGAFGNIRDVEGYRREAQSARSLGFIGKTCIHPSQVPLANEVFRPSDAEIAHALEVVRAAEVHAVKGVGAFTVDGRMIDAPFIRRARAVVEVARRLGLAGGASAGS